MMMRRLLCLGLVIAMLGCNSTKCAKRKTYSQVEGPVLSFETGPPTLVYKTKANYDTLVPIILNEDKTEILSYPHPSDLVVKGNGEPAVRKDFMYPTVLEDGYRLDNRGINGQVAFLNISYRAYATLDKPPSLEELKALILDSDPLKELCHCGNRHAFKDVEKQLNKLIVFGNLRKDCRVVK